MEKEIEYKEGFNWKLFFCILIVLFIGMLIGTLIDMYFTPYKVFPAKAPNNYISLEQIHITKTNVCIDINDSYYSTYAGTGSMRPALDENANGITIVPKDKDEIHLGDLITYTTQKCVNNSCTEEDFIIHRVILIGYDENGWYVITKGDHNNRSDDKVRWEQIKHKTVMLIY